MKFIELAQGIQSSYQRYFPNSSIDIGLSTSLYPTLYVTPRLAKTLDEVQNRIAGNDMFHIQISITYVDKPLQRGVQIDSDITEELQIEYDRSSYSIKTESQYMAYGARKITSRKSKGTPDKVLKALDAYFCRLKESVCKDVLLGNIHPNYTQIVLTKI